MFDDKYGLTKAVLEGRKTMTRRIIKAPKKMDGKDVYGFAVVRKPGSNDVIEVFATDADGAQINNIIPKYKPGEVVAVAQNYKEVGIPEHCMVVRNGKFCDANATGGWTNKMFVHPDHMKHFVRITNVRVERLQDISDEDCKKEGVDYIGGYSESYYLGHGVGNIRLGNSYREAFAVLIDRLSGKGTWDKNPWVFVYEFELVK